MYQASNVERFADLIGQRILIEGPMLSFTPGAAQGIGLALHELATNAGKYGALTDLKGRVDMPGHAMKVRSRLVGPRAMALRSYRLNSAASTAL